jgi:hypothetical protein
VSLNVPDSCSLVGDAAGEGAGAGAGRGAWCFFAGLCLLCDFFVTHRLAASLTPSCTMGPATETTAATTTPTTSRSAARLIGPRPRGATGP